MAFISASLFHLIDNNRSLHRLRAGTHTAEHSRTIFLAMVTQALLRGTPSPCTLPPARLAVWHLSIFFGHFVSSQKEKHPWEKWHITNFALGSRARLRPLSGAVRGERLLKLQQPLSSNSTFAAGGRRLQRGGAGAKASFFYFSPFVQLN